MSNEDQWNCEREDEVMTRQLGEVPPGERAEIVATVHEEAEEAKWHTLANKTKGVMYRMSVL